MKKLFAFLVMLFSILHVSAYDFWVENDDGVLICYNILEDGNSVEVTSQTPNKYSGIVTIPSTVSYNGKVYNVTSIGKEAFLNCMEKITAVNMPESITSIGDLAFAACWGLTAITIPKNVTSIGNSAFSSCAGLTTITIPEKVISIGSEAFSVCWGLTAITIPENVTSIGDGAFFGCTGLKELIYNAISCNSYSRGGWFGDSLEKVTIGEKVQVIPNNIFFGCTGLTTITIPENVTSIGYRAFSGCTGLSTITIPENVTSIGNEAFFDCTELKELIYNAISCTDCNSDWFFLNKVTIGEKVQVIPNNIFFGCTGLTTITIPENVTSIGYRAFSGCTGLSTITIPENVTSIGGEAFSGCTGLTTMTIPEKVTSIGVGTFSGCTRLKELTYNAINCNSINSSWIGRSNTTLEKVTIGEKVEIIPNYIFSSCTSLKELTYNAINCNNIKSSWIGRSNTTLEKVTIGEKVEVIPNYTFTECTGIKDVIVLSKNYATSLPHEFQSSIQKITFGEKVEVISGDFSNYSNLRELVVDASNKNYTSIENILFSKNITKLITHPAARDSVNYDIPKSVTSIESYAFAGCNRLESINIPGSVTSIGESAFYSSTSLREITLPPSITSIEPATFSGCTNLSSIIIPESITSIGDSAFSDCTSLTSFIIPENVTSISSRLFFNCMNLTSITIPQNVRTISDSSFSGCISLVAIAIPESVTSIESSAFSGCTSLASITIPEKVRSINERVFFGCTSLTTIAIPEGVNSIESSAFASCTSLASIVIPKSAYRIKSNAFTNCSNLTEIIYNARNCEITSDWLDDTKNALTQITIGEKVQTLPEFIFSDCNNLSQLTFVGNSLTSIGNSAFANCNKLTLLNLPKGIISIGNSAFASCNGLTSLALPEGVTSIGSNSFANCSGLTSLTIPESMESIGNYAFYACEGLKDIYCRMQTPSTNSTIFDEVDKANCRLHVPAGTYEAYSLAEAWKDFILREEYKTSATIAAGEGTVLINGKEITSLYILEEEPSVTFTILPATGFHIDKVILNGEDVTTALVENVLTVEQVKEDQVLTVTFTESFSITAAFDAEKGTVFINGEDTVSANILEGNPVTFTITSKTGYQLSGILLNGEDVTSWLSNNTLTIENVRENILLEVTFSAKLFTINSTFDTTKGIVFIDEKENTFAQIQEGKTAVITVSPKVGYQLYKVFLNEKDVTSLLINNTLTIKDIRENQSIEIMFNEKRFEVKAIFDPECGSVRINHEETALTTIQEGKPAIFTISSSFGYQIEKITLNEEDITESLTDNMVVIDSVMKSQIIEVVFGEKLFEVTNTFNAEQGTVLVNNTDTTMITIQEGKPATFTIIPKVGYQLNQVLLNQKDLTSSVIDGTLVIESITENQSLETLFKEKLSLVATTFNTAQGNVLINGENISPVNIQEGKQVTFTILPAMGYKVEKVLLNEEDVTSLLADNTLTVESVIGNQFLKVMFNLQLFNVTTTFNKEGGSVLLNGKAADTLALQEGDIAEFTITPNEDYFIEKVLFNGEDVMNEVVNGTLLIKTIMEDSSLEVTFQNKNYVSTSQSGVNPIMIYAKDGAIHLNSSERIINVMISNSAGTLIFAEDILGEEIVSLPAGIYFVKFGNTVIKVGVK